MGDMGDMGWAGEALRPPLATGVWATAGQRARLGCKQERLAGGRPLPPRGVAVSVRPPSAAGWLGAGVAVLVLVPLSPAKYCQMLWNCVTYAIFERADRAVR